MALLHLGTVSRCNTWPVKEPDAAAETENDPPQTRSTFLPSALRGTTKVLLVDECLASRSDRQPSNMYILLCSIGSLGCLVTREG
jgi:hypothetical protein